MVVDVEAHSYHDGANVSQFTYYATDNQLWEFCEVVEDTSDDILITEALEINGIQVNNTITGHRTIYSAQNTILNQSVKEVGLVYSIYDYADETEMIVDSKFEYVRSVKAEIGKMSQSCSTLTDADSYAMTVKISSFTSAEYTADWKVRVYAKLSDGTYVYSAVKVYSIYDVASVLYDNVLMTSAAAHEGLYSEILSVVNPEYVVKEYEWNNLLVK